MSTEALPIDEVLLSMQRALWNVVTPDLRTVVVRVSGMDVHARFIYDQPITEEILELVEEADEEALADLPDGSCTYFDAEYLPPTERREVRDGETWVYLRREAGST